MRFVKKLIGRYNESIGKDYYRNTWKPNEYKKAAEKAKEEAEMKDLSSGNSGQNQYLGTVGALALDQSGNLAAATSTGGLTNKMYGRVGDTPIIGAGIYANNKTCAVSGTG